MVATLPAPWLTSTYKTQFFANVAKHDSVLLLDYDGTLAPFRRERLEAKPYDGVLARLRRLATVPVTRLVLVTGRPARELHALLGIEEPIEIWGSHGREHLARDGGYHMATLSAEQNDALSRIHAALRLDYPEGALERKGASLAVHWRALGAGEQIALRSRVEKLHGESGAPLGLQMLAFDGGIEIRSGAIHKGTVVETILKQSPEAAVAYLGDDTTDEDAFRALRGKGATLLVAAEPRPTAAQYLLRPPGEVLAFLDAWLAAACGARV